MLLSRRQRTQSALWRPARPLRLSRQRLWHPLRPWHQLRLQHPLSLSARSHRLVFLLHPWHPLRLKHPWRHPAIRLHLLAR